MDEKRNLKKIEADLLKRKLELEQKLTEMSKEQFSDGQVQDPGDQALTATMESLRMSLQDAELEEYRGISKALERIKEGEYGLCIDCGNPISEKRLSSFPGTMRCLACQENFEEKLDQGAH
ncbi:MAG TPA: TraR/DksA family transcriptional regulator [Candidatus Babeliales bacterium]|nr:TraR/DksA family transcriptional regulator [Candidatus Babeliales bacterium]